MVEILQNFVAFPGYMNFIKINFNEFNNVFCSQIRKERKCTKLNRRPISKECKTFQVFNSFNAEKTKNALPNEMQVLKCKTFKKYQSVFCSLKKKRKYIENAQVEKSLFQKNVNNYR